MSHRIALLAASVALFATTPGDASPAPFEGAFSRVSFVPSLAPPSFGSKTSLRLDDPLATAFGVDRFEHPDLERRSIARTFLEGRWGAGRWRIVPELTLGGESHPALDVPIADDALAAPVLAEAPPSLSLDMLEFAKPASKKPCTRKTIRLARMGGESDVLPLLSCDGSLLPDALDRLSVMARPTGTARPPVPLPDEPAPETSVPGEWVDNVRLLHPRLAWVVQQIGDAFPWREIYLISGYRRPTSGHPGMHGLGRAIDLFVMNVPNERVYALCRKLPDVGCGYYPNNKFVHVDVRRPGSGHPFWIDDSWPGEPSHYVDAWPGVERGGGAVWAGNEAGQP